VKARFYIFMKQKTQKLNKYILSLISLILVLIFASPVLASEINAENVIRYVNEARNNNGLKELRVSEKLTAVATAKVNDMVAHNYFAHTSPAGLTPWHWFEKIGYDYKYAGENLAINFTTAEAQQVAWMNSPTHRKNILNENYHEIGVAVAAGEVNGTLGIIAVQEFGTLAHPGAGSEEKNFAPAKDKALPDTTKFVPTVLSTGDQKINQKIDENLKKAGEEITAPKSNWTLADGAGNAFWLILCIIAILPLMVVQIVSVGRSLNLPGFQDMVRKGYATNAMRIPREYFRRLKVKNYDKYRIVKVRVITA
jgi:hypothetical protein